VCADVHCIKVALSPPKIAASHDGDGAASIELLDADSYTSRCVHNSGGCRWQVAKHAGGTAVGSGCAGRPPIDRQVGAAAGLLNRGLLRAVRRASGQRRNVVRC
jgi:hypothetical protein